MLRALLLATCFLVVPRADATQALRVLHIKIVLVDADGKATPIPHYLLLVSDNPATALPRRVVTALDGTADVSLRPGNYTVESDRPIAFQGKAYQWTQIVDIPTGRDAVLELGADNAEVESAAPSTASASRLEADPSSLLALWQDSVVAIWTPTTHASGFIIDPPGLIATSQRVVGTATSVEVQLTPTIKVAARVLTADAARDVAVLAIDPKALPPARPVPLACAQPANVVAEGQELFTIGAPLRGQKGTASGTVSRVEPHAIISDVILADGSAGGPVFNTGGELIGITTIGDDRDEGSRRRTRIARVDDACGVVTSAGSKMQEWKATAAAHLPVEPLLPFPMDAFKEAAKRRAGSLSPYQMAATDFDVNFITPLLIYGAQYQAEQMSGRERGTSTRKPPEPALVRPLMDFSNWSEYVADYPPVLFIRVTPKLVENFWTTVARGAARTQGVALPPIKHFKSGFSRMRLFCGDAEVTPIHPFKLEQRVSENDAIYEGLYAFDPGALRPQCGTVKLVLYSEKEPERADNRVVDSKVVEQIWEDFAPYRL